MLGDVVRQVPMAALVGVMIMVSVGTFDWHSLRTMNKVPLGDTIVMVVTVVIVVATSNLAIGVVTGVILSALNFGWKMARIHAQTHIDEHGVKVYEIKGQMFFGTMNHFVHLFHYQEDPEQIAIDFSHSHVWDQSGVNAVSKVLAKYEALDKKVAVRGLNPESQRIIDKIGVASVSSH